MIAFLAACQKPYLSVKMRPFDRNDLASTIVDTPDPIKEAPIFGQRLYIRWYVPETLFKCAPVTLNIRVRFNNGEEAYQDVPLHERWGNFLWVVTGDDYINKGGIMAYRIALIADNKILAKTDHKFWVEKITVE